ncbi:ROK family protein [Gracilibacillus alcaliphilus]|uniref:ROK family protein n=1 Tax=Gracilibacillus alcaliphilus TaxID=1401441 RepID=UPI00195C508C|nr:ROK family protein [Gracilibacillus alcaliphilus]MBM7677719.1 glucokinase [Gracilibacillus alcaliphilus]
MSNRLMLALDVGGTFTKGCVIDNHQILTSTIKKYNTYSYLDADAILNNFKLIIENFVYQYLRDHNKKNINQLNIGFTFPGPFDYQNGISYVKGVGKFETLYEMNIREEIRRRLLAAQLPVNDQINIRFENDCRLFGIGVNEELPAEKLICLTIGTGLGSTFLDQGNILKNRKDIPPEGYLYQVPYKTSIVDDYFSIRGILKLASSKGIDIHRYNTVKDISLLAKEKNDSALKTFEIFGNNLAEMLEPYIQSFQPNKVVIGGQIAKSFDLFGNPLQQVAQQNKAEAVALKNALYYTFKGIDVMLNNEDA